MNNSKNTVTETQAFNALRLAQCNEHKGSMVSSAKLCVEDAVSLFNRGEFTYAAARAVDSLSYSVGTFSPIYQSVAEFGNPAWVAK